jgi:hypothetical protein
MENPELRHAFQAKSFTKTYVGFCNCCRGMSHLQLPYLAFLLLSSNISRKSWSNRRWPAAFQAQLHPSALGRRCTAHACAAPPRGVAALPQRPPPRDLEPDAAWVPHTVLLPTHADQGSGPPFAWPSVCRASSMAAGPYAVPLCHWPPSAPLSSLALLHLEGRPLANTYLTSSSSHKRSRACRRTPCLLPPAISAPRQAPTSRPYHHQPSSLIVPFVALSTPPPSPEWSSSGRRATTPLDLLASAAPPQLRPPAGLMWAPSPPPNLPRPRAPPARWNSDRPRSLAPEGPNCFNFNLSRGLFKSWFLI